MAIKLQFDAVGVPMMPVLQLASHAGIRLGTIVSPYGVRLSEPLVECSEMSFTVDKREEPLWDKILDFKLVYAMEWDTWMQCQVNIVDGDVTIKEVSCRGLGESELSQILVHGLEFNTDEDIELDDYERRYIFKADNPNASILAALFEKAPHYTIEHVDASIANQVKTFTFDGVSIHDALNTIAQECDCLVIYNNTTNPETNMPARGVSLYDLETICNDCGYRGEYTDVCPNCGGSDLNYGYGNDTTIFVTKDNLTEEVTYTTDLDSVKNCFKLVAGDDLMTSAIQACNPNGTDYIWYISSELKDDMPVELVDKIEQYDELFQYYQKDYPVNLDADLVASYNELVRKYKTYNNDLAEIGTGLVGYPSLMNILYDVIDFESFIESALMPVGEEATDTSAAREANKLGNGSLSPVALAGNYEFSQPIIDGMVLSNARLIVDTRYDVKIKESQIQNIDETNGTCQWIGSFTVTQFGDEDETTDTGSITVEINKDYETYIRQRINLVLAAEEGKKDYSISALLDVDTSLDDFKRYIKPYNIQTLLNVKDSCDTILDTLLTEHFGNERLWSQQTEGTDMYNTYYLNYYNKMQAIVEEIQLKESEKAVITSLKESVIELRNEIQKILNFQNYLGEELWLIFCCYRREDIYKNDNYISDDLTNEEIFDHAREFYDTAAKEIFKSATLQHSISSTLKDLLVIPEFEPLRNNFQVGNWLRIMVDGVIYRLRLVKYELDFDRLEELQVEFSDVTRTADGIVDMESLLNRTQSMATSYGAVMRQATKGAETSSQVGDWFRNGLDATLMRIVNDGGTQNAVIDNHGILLRDYDEITDSYAPTQMKFINSMLAITDDDWKTIRTAVGNFIYQDPVSGVYKDAYGVNAEVVVGSLILGQELGIYNADASLQFNEDGLTVHNDTNGFRVDPNSATLLSVTHDSQQLLWLDDNGMLHISGDGAGLDISSNNSVTGLQTALNVEAGLIRGEITDATNNLNSTINQTAEQIMSEVNALNGDLNTKITQTSDSITAEVNNLANNTSSRLTQHDNEISAIVTNADDLRSSLTITDSSIRALVTDTDARLDSKIDQTASAIRSEVTDGYNNLQTTVTQTTAELRSEAQDLNDALSSSISQTASQIRSEVADSNNNLQTSITQNANAISINATAIGQNAADIQVNADKIAMVVTGQGSASSMSMTPWAINAVADAINLDGLVTFSGLSQGAKDAIAGNISTALASEPKFYYQANEPSSPNNGDVWYQLDNNGVVQYIKTRVGDAWVTHTTGTTTINGGTITTDLLAANAVTTAKLHADALKSTNYSEPTTGTNGTSPYSVAGTYYNLSTGDIISPNFVTNSSGAYINGTVIAGSGSKIGPWQITDTSIWKVSGTMGNGSAGAAYFGDDGLSITDKFTVTDAGVLSATDATVSGILTAGVGSVIGPFTIDANSIYTGTLGAANSVYVSTGTNASATIAGRTGNGWAFTVGDSYGVTDTGALYCTNANVQGTIDADSGRIGLWSIAEEGNNKYLSGTYEDTVNNIQYLTRLSTAAASNSWVFQTAYREKVNGEYGSWVQTGHIDRGGNFYANQLFVGSSGSWVNAMRLIYNGDNNGLYISDSSTVIAPYYNGLYTNSANDHIQFGDSNRRFTTIYLTSSPNVSSDKRIKTSIFKLDKCYENAYMKLDPVGFMLKNTNGTSHDRKHYGFIAQDVESAFNSEGINNNDLGFLCIDDNGQYSLRYEEIIALNTHMTQKAISCIEELKIENDMLKSRISELESKIFNK